MKKPVIEFNNFSFHYFSQADKTLEDINLTIYEGEKVLIVGPSGSGKSTLSNCLNGLIPFSFKGEITGSLKIAGEETKELDIFELSKKVGTVLQDTDGQFIGLTVAEDIAFSLENNNITQKEMTEIVHKAAELVDMDKFLNSSPHELSGGQKQRVSLGGVLVDDVNILLFDEPLANLDPKTGQTTIELIDKIHNKYKKTIVIIEHRLEDVLVSSVDRIIVMNDGKIQADMTPDELMEAHILPKYGIREPLYITAMRYAGVDITKKLQPGRLQTLTIDIEKEKICSWNTSQTQVKSKTFTEEILRLENIGFKYDSRHKSVLKDINFSVKAGEMISIVGTNGAGKTTLAKLICGIVKDYEGNLFLDGKDMRDMTIKERSQSIGYVMQNPNQMICKPMIFDEVALGLRLAGMLEEDIKPKVDNALSVCGLSPFIDWPISALSYGQKKRVTIASILAMEPKILILDEPTAGQDYFHYTEIMHFLRKINETGITVILITHDMHLMLENTPRTLVLHQGQLLLDGTSVEALTNSGIADKASLKITSLFHLAEKAGIEDKQGFVQNFINYEEKELLKTRKEDENKVI